MLCKLSTLLRKFSDTCGSDSECIMGCSRDSLDCNERCPCYDACPNGCPCPHSSGYCPTQVQPTQIKPLDLREKLWFELQHDFEQIQLLSSFIGRVVHYCQRRHYSRVWWLCLERVWAMPIELSGHKFRIVFWNFSLDGEYSRYENKTWKSASLLVHLSTKKDLWAVLVCDTALKVVRVHYTTVAAVHLLFHRPQDPGQHTVLPNLAQEMYLWPTFLLELLESCNFV